MRQLCLIYGNFWMIVRPTHGIHIIDGRPYLSTRIQMRPTSQHTGATSLNLPARYMVLHQALAQAKGYKVTSLWKWMGVAVASILLLGVVACVLTIQSHLAAILQTTRQINVTLGQSNRAYVIAGAAQIDELDGTLTLPLRNSGRIPSGQIVVVIHTATVDAAKPHLFPNVNAATGYAWQRHSFNSLVPGEGQEVVVQLQKFAPKRVVQALQMIVISGQIIYNDGLPEDQLDRRSFCVQTVYEDDAAQISWRDCNAEVVLPQMVALDGYPKTQQLH